MASLEIALNWFEQRRGKVTYSMVNRNGPNSWDCSSSVYHALIAGGLLPSSQWIGNTDSEFSSLESNGWVQVQPNAQGNFDNQRGDVFIWGVRGASSGAFGHTGMFTDADNIIHCSSGYNGIAISNYDWLHSINGNAPQTFYRYVGNSAPAPAPNDPNDQSLVVGSYIKFADTYTADDVQLIEGTWQVRTTVLCRNAFTWEENGIPAEPLVEVTPDGFATGDQELAVGSLYKIPRRYQVLDLGYNNDMWMAQIQSGEQKFWVDVATATEVPESDTGTATPAPAPQPQPVVVPEVPQKPISPVDPVAVPVPVNDPTVETPKPDVAPVEPVVQPTKSNQFLVVLGAIVQFVQDLIKSFKTKK